MDGKAMSAAWKSYMRNHPSHFDGAPSGRYLENRLESAFLAGIVAAEVRARARRPKNLPSGEERR